MTDWSLAALFAVFVIASLWERHILTRNANQERRELIALAAEERRALEDRLVAMTDKDASILVHAQEENEPGDVYYVDEKREWELSGGGGGDARG